MRCETVNLSPEARLFSALKPGWDPETPAPVWKKKRKSRKWDYPLKSRLNWWAGLLWWNTWSVTVWQYDTDVWCVMWSSIRAGVFLTVLVTHSCSFACEVCRPPFGLKMSKRVGGGPWTERQTRCVSADFVPPELNLWCTWIISPAYLWCPTELQSNFSPQELSFSLKSAFSATQTFSSCRDNTGPNPPELQ